VTGLLTSQRKRNVAAYLMNDAIDAQIEARCGRHSSPPSCRLGYVPLGELRRYYGVR